MRRFLILLLLLTIAQLPFAPGAADAEPVPVLLSVNPTAAYPGGAITVTGNNFNDIQNWKVVVELTTGEKFQQVPVKKTVNQFTFKPPMIYTGMNVTAKNAEHRNRIKAIKLMYVQKGTLVSNKLPFQIMSFYPIIDPPSVTTFKTGDPMTLAGGNWDTNALYAPNQYSAVFEYLPGRSVKAPIVKPLGGSPFVPIPLAPAGMSLVGTIMVKVPDVYCGLPQEQQDVLSKYKGKFYIYSNLGPNFPSNSFDIQIAKKPLTLPNPSKTTLGPFYNAQAPNRTVAYRGSTYVMLPCRSEKAVITGVKNTSQSRIRLSAGGSAMVDGIWLNPGETTSAFNGKTANVQWEAIGPESSKGGPSHVFTLEVTWKAIL
jgi:hypothetical protein